MERNQVPRGKEPLVELSVVSHFAKLCEVIMKKEDKHVYACVYVCCTCVYMAHTCSCARSHEGGCWGRGLYAGMCVFGCMYVCIGVWRVRHTYNMCAKE